MNQPTYRSCKEYRRIIDLLPFLAEMVKGKDESGLVAKLVQKKTIPGQIQMPAMDLIMSENGDSPLLTGKTLDWFIQWAVKNLKSDTDYWDLVPPAWLEKEPRPMLVTVKDLKRQARRLEMIIGIFMSLLENLETYGGKEGAK